MDGTAWEDQKLTQTHAMRSVVMEETMFMTKPTISVMMAILMIMMAVTQIV